MKCKRGYKKSKYELETSFDEIITAGGLVFISGAADKKLWAFDKNSGKLLWETELPAANNANVCSFYLDGKQFIALSVGGTKDNPSGSIMAFKLP